MEYPPPWEYRNEPMGYGEVSQTIETPQYAGPLRIPPENFQLRVRKEGFGRDTVNSHLIESWNAAVPRQQGAYFRVDISGQGIATRMARRGLTQPDSTVPASLATTYEDMLPVNSRSDPRDFRQSKPYDPTGPALALNPYFDRYDPTRDPRNMIREVRSVVYELKEADRGLEESARIRQRNFANQYVPEGETPTRLTQAYELMRPKIDNPEVVYRGQNTLWKYGSPTK